MLPLLIVMVIIYAKYESNLPRNGIAPEGKQ